MVEEPLATELPLVDGGAHFFDEAYLTNHDRLVRLAALLLGSTAAAEDVVQDAFAKLHPRLDRVDQPAAWLRTVVVRACHNERRRLATAKRHASRLASGSVTVDEPISAMVEHVRRLPPRQRAVVVLRFYEDLAEADIARAMGIRLGTVKSTLHRALANLRKEMADG